MPFFQFNAYPIWFNLGIFAVLVVIIWFAGARLSAYADLIADRTGVGKAFIGLVLLAGATSLPEIGTTVSASWVGNAPLAVNNLLGGIAMQTAVLAIADCFVARGALTFFNPGPAVILAGALLILLLGLTLAAIASNSMGSLFSVGWWTVLLFAMYLVSLYLLKDSEGRGSWRPVELPQALKEAVASSPSPSIPSAAKSTTQLFGLFAAGGTVILIAGVTVAQVSDALAQQTGLGASFVGATLVAMSTSLPELSTTIAAARLGAYSMAISNIFGSNALMVGLLFVSDVFYREGPILEAVDPSAIFAAASGVVVTSVYLIGLIERRNQAVGRLGLDSLTVLFVYAGTVLVLYTLR